MGHFYGSRLVLGIILALLGAMVILTGDLQAVLKFEFSISLSCSVFRCHG